MKVSVIIPVYNVSAYIERCLLSVLNQTWQDLEIIVVDDCTPDDSMEIVRKIAMSHPKGSVIRCVLHEINKGQSAARNTAIKIATGDFLYFLDSDDYLPLHSIESLMQYAIEGIYDFVLGNYEIVGDYETILYTKMLTSSLYADNIIKAYAYDILPRTVWNMVVKRSFILSEELFFEEGIIHEDDLWTFFLVSKAKSAFILNKTTYYYYTHSNSTTGNPSLRNLECRIRIIGLMYEYILKHSDTLQKNKYVYVTFEEAKAKYFDRILYYTKDQEFQLNSYKLFREKHYALKKCFLFMFLGNNILWLRNMHYRLPMKLGFLYFKCFVKIAYDYLILKIKIRQLFSV